jgi:hypothetical protein
VFSFYGVDAEPIIEAIATKSAPKTSPIFVHWKKNGPFVVQAGFDFKRPFDLAGCMSRNLPDKLFSELKSDDTRTLPAVVANVLKTGSLLWNLVRNVAGPVFLLGVWILVFSRHRLLYFPIVITVFALSGAHGMLSTGGAHSNPELTILPLILLIVGGLVQHAWEWYGTRKSPNV